MRFLFNYYKNNKDLYIKANGASMLPLYQPNDIIYFKKINYKKIKVNDTVISKNGYNFSAHRVIFKNSSFLVTKGDNNLQSDGKIKPWRIIGKVYQVKRDEKLFNPEDVYLLQSTLYFQEIVKIKQILEKENIDFVFLKGLPLHLYFEKTHPRRLYADCDILLNKKNQNKVDKILKNLGFKPEDKNRYKQFSKFLLPELKEVEYFKNTGGFTVVLDIHFIVAVSSHKVSLPLKMFDSAEQQITDDFINQKKFVNINNISFPILNTDYLIIYLLLHFFSHNWVGIYRLEFISVVAKKVNRADWIKIFSYVKNLGIINFIIPGIYLLKKYFYITLPTDILKEKYRSNFDFSINIFKKFYVEKKLFDFVGSKYERINKALLIFLYYEVSIFNKIFYLLNPLLILHFIYFLGLIGYHSLSRRFKKIFIAKPLFF